MKPEELERIYGRAEYYWGTEPNEFAERTAALAAERGLSTVLDVGAGEGRDAVYFSERGFDVTAVDVVPAGLEKARRLAADRGVEVEPLRADVNTLALARPVDVVYSIGTLQYLRPAARRAQFDHLKARTTPGGLHALFAFVDGDVPTAPDWGENEHLYGPEELPSYYGDWERLFSATFVFDDDSGGEPHRHEAQEVIYRRPPTIEP